VTKDGGVMVNVFVGNTDQTWYDFLSSQLNLAEINFWRPSEISFHALQEGELFAFRLKSPVNKIAGFGIFANSLPLSLHMAWETFGISNGAASYDNFESIIAQYRPNERVGPNTRIVCRILVEPVFFPPNLWFDVPPSFPKHTMGGKRFSTDEEDGRHLWHQLQDIARAHSLGTPSGFAEPIARYGAPTLITPRLGQGAFRIAVIEAYDRQCAISDGKVLPALDAAHIRPYAHGGEHKKSNGILLRKDIHCVFDAGYATIDPDYRFVVSKKVKEVFNNGEEYRRLHGKGLRLPNRSSDYPDPNYLRWHNDNRFLG
jgi:putative restriction endonuclease